MPSDILAEVRKTYEASDGDATKALYRRLEEHGTAGVVAVNLLRACKCSERAKKYRGGNGNGSYRSQAYERKAWSIDNLCRVLGEHAEALGIAWGWGKDASAAFHDDVLYIELPTGQCSFHNAVRGDGPAFGGEWDRARGMSAPRIVRYAAEILEK